MSHSLTRKWIMNQCKEVSYKKGASFVTNKKVKQLQLTSNVFLAEVDNEQVTISNYQDILHITCKCTCPKLESVSFYCQHIAAALLELLAIYEMHSKYLQSNNQIKPTLKQKEHLEFRECLPFQLQIKWQQGKTQIDLLLHHKVYPLDIFLLENQFDCQKFYIEAKLYEIIKSKNIAKENLFSLDQVLPSDQITFIINAKKVTKVQKLKKLLPIQVSYINDSIFLETKEKDVLLLIEEKAFLVNDELILVEEKAFLFIQQLFVVGKLQIDRIHWSFVQKNILAKLHTCFSFIYEESYINWEQRKPLKVQLFLDRFKDQLLVSLDFQYGDFSFNPFTFTYETPFIRNEVVENQYLAYLESFHLEKVEEGYILNDEEKEYDFLHVGLKHLPVPTQIFATTGVRNRIIPASKFPKIKVHVKKERTNWLAFSFDTWQLSKEEILGLMEAIRLNKKYYPLKNGSLFSLDLKEKEQIQKFLNGISLDEEFDPYLIEVPINKSLPFLFGSFIEQTDSFKEFIQSFYAIPKEKPRLQSIELKDYQLQGIQWMEHLSKYGLGGVLADDMGLGKTIQAIGFISRRSKKEKTLIICPTSVVYQWKQELNKLLPNREVLILDGDVKTRQKKQAQWTDEILLTSYDLLKRDISFFKQTKWDTIFLDEAQMFKNPQTLLFRQLKKLDAKQKFALTGTPIENNLVELWSIFHIVLPEVFGTLDSFRVLTKEEISNHLSIFFLRRTKEKIQLHLPKKYTHIVEIELNAKEKHYYAAYLAKLKEETFKKLNKEVSVQQQKIIFLAALTKLRQICCHLQLIDKKEQEDSSKLIALLRMIHEAKLQNKKVLVFSQFTTMLKIISLSLVKEDISYLYLDGQTKKEDRQQLVEEFNNGLTDVFLISLKAGGVGLNLTGASIVIMYDSWWNPMVESQAEDRAYRIGQTEDVHIIKLITKGTIEEKLQELQDKKRDLVEEIFTMQKNPLFSLGEDQIKNLLE